MRLRRMLFIKQMIKSQKAMDQNPEKRPRNFIGPKSPTKPSMGRRANFHNYGSVSTYFVTLIEADRRPLFGTLVFDPIPKIVLTAYGARLVKEEIPKIHAIYPEVYVWHYVIMPDHIHFILRVGKPLPRNKTLGAVIGGFKSGCNKLYREMGGEPGRGVFQPKFNDRILMNDGQLSNWHTYINDNPRRLALKVKHPDLFTVLYDKKICDVNCQIVGNRFLLDYPEKMAVIVHRSDSHEEHQRHCEEWLACGARGGVLVSASIAPREKEICRTAMELGYRIISLAHEGFRPLYKPVGRSFDACVEGRLLKISPWPYNPRPVKITRSHCLFLNALAEKIAATSHFRFLDQ